MNNTKIFAPVIAENNWAWGFESYPRTVPQTCT